MEVLLFTHWPCHKYLLKHSLELSDPSQRLSSPPHSACPVARASLHSAPSLTCYKKQGQTPSPASRWHKLPPSPTVEPPSPFIAAPPPASPPPMCPGSYLQAGHCRSSTGSLASLRLLLLVLHSPKPFFSSSFLQQASTSQTPVPPVPTPHLPQDSTCFTRHRKKQVPCGHQALAAHS